MIRRIRDNLEEIAFYTIFTGAYGALTGELMDHVPYLKDAIPDAMGYMDRLFNSSIPNYNPNLETLLRGHLELIFGSIGALYGFSIGLIISETKQRSNIKKH